MIHKNIEYPTIRLFYLSMNRHLEVIFLPNYEWQVRHTSHHYKLGYTGVTYQLYTEPFHSSFLLSYLSVRHCLRSTSHFARSFVFPTVPCLPDFYASPFFLSVSVFDCIMPVCLCLGPWETLLIKLSIISLIKASITCEKRMKEEIDGMKTGNRKN